MHEILWHAKVLLRRLDRRAVLLLRQEGMIARGVTADESLLPLAGIRLGAKQNWLLLSAVKNCKKKTGIEVTQRYACEHRVD